MNKQLKIFDCSNSSERPPHRDNSFGPKENDIVADLKKYSSSFGATFVNSIDDCNIIFTNDVFPSYLKKSKIPKIKRMDGVYWNTDFTYRNAHLNEAALIADKVIFISTFSAASLNKLYPLDYKELKKPTVILNTADNSIFYPKWYKENKPNKELKLTAIASSWTRKEKRFDSILKLAIKSNMQFNIIGDCPFENLPSNINNFGYIEKKERVADILREQTDIFVNLSYADACPKVVSQARASGLPILYAMSGGLEEQVCDRGCFDGLFEDLTFSNEVPKLDDNEVFENLSYMAVNYKSFREMSLETIPNHMMTMYKYFKAFREML